MLNYLNYKSISNNISWSILLRQIADSLTIYLACLLSNFIFLQDFKISAILIPSFSLFVLLFIVFIPTFYLLGLYTYVRNFDRKFKVIRIFKASIYAALFLILIFFIFNYYFDQNFKYYDLIFSDISVAWLFTLLGTTISRFFVYSYLDIEEIDTSSKLEKNTILIIGGAGYIGSSLVAQLLERNYKVRLLDILLFGEEPIADFSDNKNFEVIKGDFRKVDDLFMAINGCQTVIHLGGIVGDPACSIDEALTKDVNLTATKIIGQIAKSAGVRKFIFASSCSVYGAQDIILNENSDTKPLSLYAKTKIASEQILQEMSDDNFSPIFLRFGTVYGFSGRTRFDLVVNLLTANAYFKQEMTVYGKDQIRPFLHVNDAAYSIVCALETNFSRHDSLVFNIGSNAQNCTLFELAELIQKNIPESEIIVENVGDDGRNYHVCFDKAERILNYKVKWSLDDGIKQVIKKFENGDIVDYSQAKYSNVKHLHEQGLKVLTQKEISNWEEMLLDESYN